MTADPGVVRRHVVGNEVENQPQAALTEVAPRGGESHRSAEMFVDDVAAYAVGRADVVLRREVGKGPLEIPKKPFVSHGDVNPCRAPLPDAHEPDGVEALRGDRIPLLFRDCGEIHASLVPAAQIIEPRPCVHLIDDGMPGPRSHVVSTAALGTGRRFALVRAPSANTACLPTSSACLGSTDP